jgi:heterotetrameric sarcosine oxidase gamma subunit
MLTPVAKSALGNPFGGVHFIGTFGGVAVTERSDIGAVLISAAVDDCAATASSLVGIDLPSAPGRFVGGAGLTAIWLSPRSWILQCPIEEEGRICRALATAFGDGSVHATGFTDQLCWLALSGGDPMELLRRGGFVTLDPAGLPVGSSRRALVTDVAVVVLSLDAARLLVGVERSRARFFADWLGRERHEGGMPARAVG